MTLGCFRPVSAVEAIHNATSIERDGLDGQGMMLSKGPEAALNTYLGGDKVDVVRTLRTGLIITGILPWTGRRVWERVGWPNTEFCRFSGARICPLGSAWPTQQPCHHHPFPRRRLTVGMGKKKLGKKSRLAVVDSTRLHSFGPCGQIPAQASKQGHSTRLTTPYTYSR
jgi:hypothetical protein